jgi:AAA domain
VLALALQHRPTKEKFKGREASEISRSLRKIREVRPSGAAPQTHPDSGFRSLEIEPAGIENQGFRRAGANGVRRLYLLKAPLPIQQLSVMVENAPAEPSWSWRGYLALYVLALLAGRPKVGKSTLAIALVAAAVRGEAFLGLPATATGVLLLTEERRDTLAEKARILGLMDAEVPVYVLTRHDAGVLPWPDVVRQAMTFCREHNLDVPIIDTLDRWTGLRGDAENAAGAVDEAMEPLQFAAAAGLAVLALSHQRKSGGEFGEAVRGSNAFTGAVDVVIELERPSRSLQLGGYARVLRSVSRFSSTPEALFFELGDDGFLPISDVAEKKSDAERAEVLERSRRTTSRSGWTRCTRRPSSASGR